MAKIHELLGGAPTTSFEFFPPKTDEEATRLEATLRELVPLSPAFVSVTYRGGAESRQRTFDLVTRLATEGHLVAMAHLICVAHSRGELVDILTRYREAGIENLMALGGDPPEDPSAAPGELNYASELVALAREVGDFSIGVAAHPAGHPRSRSLAEDRDRLAEKLEAADFAVTQFFFEAADWQGLVADLAERGVHKPVLPGIMPVTNLRSVPRMAQMGAALPGDLVARLESANADGGAEAVRAEGIAHATELCRELLAMGAPGVHLYTLNASAATREIAESLAR